MTERKDDLEAGEEHVEDLEAPAEAEEGVVGGDKCDFSCYPVASAE